MAILDEFEALILANFPHHETVAACLAELGSPSTSVSILEDGVLSTRCYSIVGDDADTVFQACSISKAINAIAVLKLVEDGRFTLSSTLRELLPSNYLDILADGSPASQRPLIEAITVKQLLSHTAGLTPSSFPGYPSTDKVPSLSEIVAGAKPANTVRFRLRSLPGYKYTYAGSGTVLLQLILEAVVGKEYPDLMRELVLEPLGMTRSFYSPLPAGENNAAKVHRNGYIRTAEEHHHLPELAAAGLWTTPADLLRAIHDVQRSLSGDGGLLRQDTAKEMITEVQDGMALGWETFDHKDKVAFGHSGSNDPGYRCHAAGYSKQDDKNVPRHSGVAAMTNSESGNGALYHVFAAITGLKGWPSLVYNSVALELGLPSQETGETWKGWKGAWKDDDSNSYVVGESDDHLPTLLYNGVGEIRLLPAVDSRRDSEGKSPTDFVLQGMLVGMKFEEKDGNKTVSLKRFGKDPTLLKRG
ncbi:hypothetical protein NQ176_g1604 [Zarea fungicola]|uniref:Uncharacterized protein n=1 Tax=Zarea fungicola TaxID=93591 RepID=A0ACC1NT64_9HYPO|nr:hypothetical protein NQ176_g1604 [Lecanicillium fungicola]